MNRAEIIRISDGLTGPQRAVMLMLDGRYSPLDLPGSYSRVCNTLRDKGLIHFTKSTEKYFNLYGSRSVTIKARLSVTGGAFIYNGGLDR